MPDMKELQAYLREFAVARDWDQFHSPKNLAMALSVEVAELVECFQWLTEEESRNLNETQLAAVRDEIADVQLYLAHLADKLDICIDEAVADKSRQNERKYPADKVRGSRKKYTEYE